MIIVQNGSRGTGRKSATTSGNSGYTKSSTLQFSHRITGSDKHNNRIENDTDTRITIEAAKGEKDIKIVKTASLDNANMKSSNVELSTTTFSGETNEHSKQFLQNLNSYLHHKNIIQTDRMTMIENFMKNLL